MNATLTATYDLAGNRATLTDPLGRVLMFNPVPRPAGTGIGPQ